MSELPPLPPTPSTELRVPPRPVQPARITLWVEIQRGWEWVKFVFRTGSRLGGPIAFFQALTTVLGLLIKRTLIQWGWIKPDPSDPT